VSVNQSVQPNAIPGEIVFPRIVKFGMTDIIHVNLTRIN